LPHHALSLIAQLRKHLYIYIYIVTDKATDTDTDAAKATDTDICILHSCAPLKLLW